MKRFLLFVCLALCLAFVFSCGGGGGGGATYTSPNSNSAKDITAFSFTRAANSSLLTTDAVGTISGQQITVTLPYGVDRTSLVATFSTTGASVQIGSTVQQSGVTSNNFTSAVDYTVTAANGTTKHYTVTVTNASSSAKDITAFSFTHAANSGLAADVAGTISGTAISVAVPFGTNRASLVASYSTTGASVRVGSTTQTSGVTPNNFTNPVTYRVVAQDATTKDYTVTVTVAPATTGSATLTWTAVTKDANDNNLTVPVTEYRIYYGTSSRGGATTAPGPYTTMVPVTTFTPDANQQITYTVNNLTVGTRYYFSVTAYNGQESQFSNEGDKQP